MNRLFQAAGSAVICPDQPRSYLFFFPFLADFFFVAISMKFTHHINNFLVFHGKVGKKTMNSFYLWNARACSVYQYLVSLVRKSADAHEMFVVSNKAGCFKIQGRKRASKVKLICAIAADGIRDLKVVF